MAKLFQLALFYDILIAGESNQMIFIAKVYTYIEHIIGSHLVDFGHCQSNFYVFIFVHCISETFKISIFFNCRQSEIKWVVDRVFLANVFIAVTYYKLFLLPQILIKWWYYNKVGCRSFCDQFAVIWLFLLDSVASAEWHLICTIFFCDCKVDFPHNAFYFYKWFLIAYRWSEGKFSVLFALPHCIWYRCTLLQLNFCHIHICAIGVVCESLNGNTDEIVA